MEASLSRMEDILRNIWDDDDYVLGVKIHIKSEYALKKMMDYLEEYKNTDIEPSNVTEISLYLMYGESIAHKLRPEIVDFCRKRGM